MIQQAITQELTLVYEPQFSDSSFGFRPGRKAHDALKQCKAYADAGYVYVVDMDLEKFFGNVYQSKLVEVLSRSIKDGAVISLIHKYLNAGIMNHGIFERSETGAVQGGPLSPLLSNVMLNELDEELERREHKFVRYADECMILCKSRRSAERTLESITRYIERKRFLKVNREKTPAPYISRVKYLGYGFYRRKGKLRFRVHAKSAAKMKEKVRAILDRNKLTPNAVRPIRLKQFIHGWVNDFKLIDMKQLLMEVDTWIRRKIRAIYWKQWKKVRTRYCMMRQYAIPEWKVHELASCRKGLWRVALMLSSFLTNEEIARPGYITMTRKPPRFERYARWCERSGSLFRNPSYSYFWGLLFHIPFLAQSERINTITSKLSIKKAPSFRIKGVVCTSLQLVSQSSSLFRSGSLL